MTSAQAPQGQNRSAREAKLFDTTVGITGTGWAETARRTENRRKAVFKKLQTNLRSYFRTEADCSSSDAMWTIFKDYLFNLNGYARGFVSKSIRATNDYKDRSVLAYAVNIFMRPFVVQFFQMKDVVPSL